METDASFLTIYDGGSEQAEIIKTLNTTTYDTKISTPRNQIYITFNTNGNDPANIRLNVEIIESKYRICANNPPLIPNSNKPPHFWGFFGF